MSPLPGPMIARLSRILAISPGPKPACMLHTRITKTHIGNAQSYADCRRHPGSADSEARKTGGISGVMADFRGSEPQDKNELLCFVCLQRGSSFSSDPMSSDIDILLLFEAYSLTHRHSESTTAALLA